MHPGKFHTPGGNKQPVEGPKGLNLTGAVRNALSPGTARKESRPGGRLSGSDHPILVSKTAVGPPNLIAISFCISSVSRLLSSSHLRVFSQER